MDSKKKIVLEKIFALTENYLAVPSPDGEKIAFLSNKTRVIECYIYELESKTINQITNGEFPVTPRGNHIWTKDSKWIVFTKDEIPGNEKLDILKINIKTKELIKLTETPENQDFLGKINSQNTELAFFSDRTGKNQIYTMDLEGSNLVKITDFQGMMIPILVYSPNDSFIYFSGNLAPNQLNFDIFGVNVKTKEILKVISLKEGSKEVIVEVSSDNSFILLYSDVSGSNRAGIYYFGSKKVKWYGNNLYDEIPTVLTSDAKYMIVHRNHNAETKVVVYNIHTGEEINPDFGAGVLAGNYTFPNSHQILVNYIDSIHKTEYFLFDIDSREKTKLIEANYGEYNPEIDFYNDNYVSYKSTDDVTIHAILLKPKVTQGKYPVIIAIHGGPTAQYLRNFNPGDQVLVDKGFIVLKPNNRGSTGYGVEFRDACINDWGGKDLDDVEAAVVFLKTLDYVDSDRIGIYGGSYGGYMTYYAISKRPNLFKAASSIVGISDLLLLYEGNKKLFPFLAQYFETQMGKPDNEETLKLWKERSAVTYAHQLETKLQIIHTKNDPRCPLNQAEVFKDKLKEHNKDHLLDYIVYEDQGHGSASVDETIRMYKDVVNFFTKNL